MIFIVQSEETVWNGHPAYLITVKKHVDLPKAIPSEISLNRMSRALRQSVNVYTEINLETMRYRQMNLKNAKHYSVIPEGDYGLVFDHMIHDEIDPDDVDAVVRTMAPEVFQKLGADSNGPDEVVARYHLKGDNKKHLMQSRAIFMRDELPHYVVAIANDVTEEIQAGERRNILEQMLNNIDIGIYAFEFRGDAMKIVAGNHAIMEMLGRRKEKVIGAVERDVFTYTHPDDYPIIYDVIEKMKKSGNHVTYQYRTRNCETGEYLWLEGRGHSVTQPDGSVMAYICYTDITESKKHELQLLQNQQAVELAQNQGGLSIWTYNLDKKMLIQQTPSDVEGHLGYPVLIENVPDCFVEGGNIYPDDITKFLTAYRKLESGAEKVDEIYRIKNLSTGKYSWTHMFYQRISDNDSAERMAAGFSMDINREQDAVEHYQIEQKLREQMYEDAVMYIEYNLTANRYEGTNNLPKNYLSSQWEYPAEETYKENMSATVDAAFLDEFVRKMYAKNLLNAFENGEAKVSCDYRSKDRPGMQATWFRITATMAQRPDTGVVIAFVYIQNIEEEKRRQLALESSMEDGIESLTIIHAADGDAVRLRVEKDWEHPGIGLHYMYDESFIRNAAAVIVPEDRDFCVQSSLLPNVIEQLATQEIYQFSFSIRHKDGGIRRQLFRYRYLDERKNDIVLSVSDITAVYLEDQKKNEQLQNSLDQAEKASHAKADFYSRMSHDMRTPMNGILGMAELSQDETDVGKLKENIEKIRESGEYLLSLVNDTLDIQRIESGKMVLEPKVVSTVDIVNNILDMMRVTAKAKGVTLKYTNGNVDLNWYIRMDALRLKQIFINLLSNAVKFTPAGGTVEWEFKLLSREGMVSHNVIYVRDTGVGMSKEFLENGIFKPFSQESNEVSTLYAGSGLGLSIAKSLIELMGGKIEVESELGVGTTFAVYLDFVRVDEAEAKGLFKEQKKEKDSLSSMLQGKRILLAEDHPLNAEIAQRLLLKVGCVVTWAKNGQEAVSAFEKEPPHTYDALLIDIRMPVMDGLEATRQIRALEKEDAATIPIIAMTANAYEEDIKASLEAGMNAHLGKPIVLQTLYETLAEYI
jgi:PAS domain S-box-containing protein